MSGSRPLFTLAVAAPLLAGLARTSGDADPKAIDAIFARYDHTNTPGCALGVFRDGRIVYSRGYGMADLNQGIPITPSTVFYIASTSKQFTAFSVALAAEQGKLSLDDPVRKFVPELPAYADSITVRQLVGHVSGVRDYLGLWGISGRSFADEIPDDVALDLIARQKALDFAPGTRWSYSNSGYFLLSVIVKRTTGLSLRQFAERNIFGPLGMTATHFHDDNQEIVARRAEGYEPKPGGGYRVFRTSFAAVGDGGLYTTVEDLLKWDNNFYDNKLGTRGQAFIQDMLTKGKLANGKETHYAFGLGRGTHRGLAVVEHGGAFIGYRAQLARFPTERLSVAVLCNEYTAQPERLAYQVADLYLADKLAPEPVAAAPSAATTASTRRFASYTGRYEVAPGMIVNVKQEGEGLVVVGLGDTFPLVPASDSEFTSPKLPGRVAFHTLPPSGVGLVVSAVGGESPAPRLGDPPTLGAAALAAFAGRYDSRELDTWATIEVRGDALEARMRYGEWVTMEPIARDVFTALGGRVAFERGRKGDVTGFRLSAARLQNVEFTRAAPR
jgi:CubicO group peptidase (beta-lactamase class C family)